VDPEFGLTGFALLNRELCQPLIRKKKSVCQQILTGDAYLALQPVFPE